MLRRQRKISRRLMLESVPRLNPQVRWERLDSGQIMAVFDKEARGLKRLVMKLLAAPAVAQVMLDGPGTKVVGAIDGQRTVAELIAYVAAEFKLSRKESEVSLLKYMEMLGRRGLVGFEVRQSAGKE